MRPLHGGYPSARVSPISPTSPSGCCSTSSDRRRRAGRAVDHRDTNTGAVHGVSTVDGGARFLLGVCGGILSGVRHGPRARQRRLLAIDIAALPLAGVVVFGGLIADACADAPAAAAAAAGRSYSGWRSSAECGFGAVSARGLRQ